MRTLTLGLLIFFSAVREAKIFSRCELASILKLNALEGYVGIHMNDWICLVHHGSGFNSKSVTLRNNKNIEFFGIFQINSRWWCKSKRGYSSNLCKIDCSAFIDDDLTDDIACAKIIVSGKQRMNAWDDWQMNCRGKNISHWTLNCEY